jgi:glycosyltransferase involved in cell wall biosynthesis
MEQHTNNSDNLKLTRLRTKVDELRVENQKLRIKLEKLQAQIPRSSGLRYHLSKAIGLWPRLLRKTKEVYRKKLNELNRQGDSSNGSGFQPYQVKILHPIQENRPRILHVIGNFYTGGSSQLVVDLIERLGHKYEQIVITRDYPQQDAYTGLDIHQYNVFTNPESALLVLQKIKPDFIHMHYLGMHVDEYTELDWRWYNNVFQAAQKINCRIIQNINIPTDPYVSDLVDYYVYVSDYVQQEFGHLNGRNITIYPGSDMAFFSRKNKGIVPDDCIGMVYRLEGDKLNANSIDVFIKVVQRRPGTKALIVGGGNNLALYKSKVQQAGVSEAFTFTGYVSYNDLPAWYEQMSLFVAPVHTESFGQVTPFAMGMELPVVGYEVGAIREIVGNPELLAAPEDSDALAEIIIKLLDDPERRLQIGRANRKRAEQLFSVEAMINSYRILYEKMLISGRAVGSPEFV